MIRELAKHRQDSHLKCDTEVDGECLDWDSVAHRKHQDAHTQGRKVLLCRLNF